MVAKLEVALNSQIKRLVEELRSKDEIIYYSMTKRITTKTKIITKKMILNDQIMQLKITLKMRKLIIP